MPWTWDEINAVWFRGTIVSDPAPHVWVELFNVVERYFGREWIDEQRFQNGIESWGPEPAAYVLSQGRRLQALDGVPGAAHLVKQLRRRESAAWAELTAIWLLASGDDLVEVEVEPHSPGTSRVPDFRIRRAGGEWTYVEVTQPYASQEQRHVEQILADLTALVGTIEGRYAVEVFLRRVPSPDELTHIRQRLPLLVRSTGQETEALPDGLGTLFLNETAPGVVVPTDHGEEYRPRFSRAGVHGELGSPQRHIVVRLAYTDDRADEILRREARHLVTSAPGLIMIQTPGTSGVFPKWESLLGDRLHPQQHTRVSGICLFRSGMALTDTGAAWEPEAHIIVNPNARLSLPNWMASHLRRFPPQP